MGICNWGDGGDDGKSRVYSMSGVFVGISDWGGGGGDNGRPPQRLTFSIRRIKPEAIEMAFACVIMAPLGLPGKKEQFVLQSLCSEP